MHILRSILAPSLALLFATVACSVPVDQEPPWTPTDLPEGTAVESWGIGDRWYKYTFTNHSITPNDISWVVLQRDGDAYFLTVDGYYDESGARTGYPRMSIRLWNGTAFGEAKQWVSTESVKEKPLCLSLETAETVDCEGDYDLIWRIDYRPIPELPMMMPNPGFYVQRVGGTKVYQYNGTMPPAALPTVSNEEPPFVHSIFDEDARPLLAAELFTPEKSVFQLLATLKIAEWQVLFNEDKSTITLQSRCVDAKDTHARTAHLEESPALLELVIDELETWTFIDLCGTTLDAEIEDDASPLTISHSAQNLRVGQWPNNKSFGIALERTDGNSPLRLWVSPDQPVEVRDADAFEPTAPPTGLWSIP